MLEVRAMPCLLLRDGALVKTIKFQDAAYVGDPVNAVRIYNELEVDELIILDIGAAKTGSRPDTALISDLASECFMPITYGGGIASVEDIRQLHKLGIEKTAINSHALEHPEIIEQAARAFGSQAIIGAIDVKRNWLGRYSVVGNGGAKAYRRNPVEWARELESRGAGEILLYAIDRDGTWEGYDLELIESVASSVSIPVIACGGAGKIEDFAAAKQARASAVAAGSMAVYQKKDFGVLINFPSRRKLRSVLD